MVRGILVEVIRLIIRELDGVKRLVEVVALVALVREHMLMDLIHQRQVIGMLVMVVQVLLFPNFH